LGARWGAGGWGKRLPAGSQPLAGPDPPPPGWVGWGPPFERSWPGRPGRRPPAAPPPRTPPSTGSPRTVPGPRPQGFLCLVLAACPDRLVMEVGGWRPFALAAFRQKRTRIRTERMGQPPPPLRRLGKHDWHEGRGGGDRGGGRGPGVKSTWPQPGPDPRAHCVRHYETFQFPSAGHQGQFIPV